ncbi:adenosine receptor A3-like isoform X2 [Hydractinia symbiolongicarpus]|nr:adenosine receptor A3-like isoform X2 [Hydractinia symbiolongicarpus]
MSSSINSSAGPYGDKDLPVYKDIPIAFWVFLSVETVVIVIANAMLCWLFLNNRQLRSYQNYFVLSLSVSDLLVGLTIAPCEYCALLNRPPQDCPLFCGSVVSFNMLASTINLVLIAGDRYYSIKKPFRYQEVMSRRRAIFVITLGWITTLFMTLLPFTWSLSTSIDPKVGVKINLYFSEALFALVFLIGVLLGIIYYTIVKLIQEKLRTSNEKSSNPAGIKVCIMVAISFFLCWIPTCIVELLVQYNVNLPHQVVNASYSIMLINPCLDPIMYAYYRRDFRRELASWRQRQWKSIKICYNRLTQKPYMRKESFFGTTDDSNNNYFKVKSLIRKSAANGASVCLTTSFETSTIVMDKVTVL